MKIARVPRPSGGTYQVELTSYFAEKATYCRHLARGLSDYRAVDALSAMASEFEGLGRGAARELPRRTLLLVEDDDTFRYAASRHLTRAGFEVVSFRTTMEALTAVDAGRHIDAFVTDIAMPKGNPHGVSFALMLRLSRPNVPILFVTGFPDLLESCALPGKVLFKPIDLDELTAEIQALFADAPEAP